MPLSPKSKPLTFISRLFQRPSRPVVVVSGLPRSGTSMMMKMLKAGGMEIVTDEQRVADEDNPQGYYELERVKKLKEGDTAWVQEAQGKAVKVISYLLEGLPPGYRYKIIFIRRAMAEILASQKQMLIRRGEPTDRASDEEMAAVFQKHLRKIETWLEEQPNMDVLYLDYAAILSEPAAQAAAVASFMGEMDGRNLDVQAMAAVPDERLHRQRKTSE